MSYCRWSSFDWKCDIYCYEDAYDGYTVHVANNRIVGDVPKTDWTDSVTLYESHKAQATFLDSCMQVPIGLPYDGETFKFDSLVELLKGLVELSALGYIVPQKVLEMVADDIDDEQRNYEA